MRDNGSIHPNDPFRFKGYACDNGGNKISRILFPVAVYGAFERPDELLGRSADFFAVVGVFISKLQCFISSTLRESRDVFLRTVYFCVFQSCFKDGFPER